MTVVSNTSPLNYLTLIGLERLLPTLFGRVIIPLAGRCSRCSINRELSIGQPVTHFSFARLVRGAEFKGKGDG